MTTSNHPLNLKSSPTDLTVEQFCNYIAPAVWDEDILLTWPPDVFAVVASLLLKSGAYSYAVSGWKRKPDLKTWVEGMKSMGANWSENPTQPPPKVRQWHRSL